MDSDRTCYRQITYVMRPNEECKAPRTCCSYLSVGECHGHTDDYGIKDSRPNATGMMDATIMQVFGGTDSSPPQPQMSRITRYLALPPMATFYLEEEESIQAVVVSPALSLRRYPIFHAV